MKKYLVFLIAFLVFGNAYSINKKIIELTEIQKTDDSIKIMERSIYSRKGQTSRLK